MEGLTSGFITSLLMGAIVAGIPLLWLRLNQIVIGIPTTQVAVNAPSAV